MKGNGGPGGGMRELEDKLEKLAKSSDAAKLSDEKKQRLKEIETQIATIKKDMRPGHGPGGPGHGEKPGAEGKHGKPPEMNDSMKPKMDEDKKKFTKLAALFEEGINLFE